MKEKVEGGLMKCSMYMNFQELMEHTYVHKTVIGEVGFSLSLSGGVKPAYGSPGEIGHTPSGSRDHQAPPTETKYACSAVHGFFRSISLSVQSSLQDTLR